MFRPLATLLGLTVLLAGAPAAPVPTHLMKGPPLYFPTQVGTKWVYLHADKKESQHRVTTAEEKDGGTLVTVDGSEGTCWLVSKSGVSIVSMGKRSCDPHLPMLKLPALRGGTWEVAAGRPDHPHPKGLFAAHGPEEVGVPAGRFQAIRVEVEWGENNKVTFWFAPGVGVIKTAGKGFEKEMKSFTPAKD